MINCFTFTYKTLKRQGYDFPSEFEGYTTHDLKPIIADYQKILDDKIHYAYFESFCYYVKKAQENDIVIHKNGVGIAINKLMYITILDSPRRKILRSIDRGCKIMRIGKEEEN